MAAVPQPDPRAELVAYASVQRAADADILRVLRDAYKDLNRELQKLARSGDASSMLKRQRLQAVKKSILEAQADVFRRTGKIIEARRVEAAARAIRVAGRYDEAAFAAVGRADAARALARGLEQTEASSVERAVARLTGSHVPLSRRVYRTEAWLSGRLERRVNSALARGLSAEDMARELREFVNPNTPGGVRYAALRLARTEINNAYHAMSIRAAQQKPWITKMEWHTSDSHARKDICDSLNGRFFPVDEVPPKPHPQCICFVTPVIDDNHEAFLDELVSGGMDAFLNDVAQRHNLGQL